MLDEPTSTYKPLTLQDWMVTILITFIPLVNIVMYFVWAFGDGAHPSKKTWAQASLLWLVISIVLSMIFFAFFGALISSAILHSQ